jgi:hypothetical protein
MCIHTCSWHQLCVFVAGNASMSFESQKENFGCEGHVQVQHRAAAMFEIADH